MAFLIIFYVNMSQQVRRHLQMTLDSFDKNGNSQKNLIDKKRVLV